MKTLEEIKEVVTFTDAKCSDWVASQPIERFSDCEPRDKNGKMCGLGMIADFYGYPWSSREANDAYAWVRNICGANFPYFKYDDVHYTKGPQAAKDFTVNWLKERGL